MGAGGFAEGSNTASDARSRGDDASHYRELADLLPDAIYETDALLRVTYGNRTAFAMFGYTQADLVTGLDLLVLMHDDDRELARTNLSRVVRGETTGPIVHKMQRKDGSVLWCEVTCAPILDPGGALAGFRGAARDVSDRVAAERALVESEGRYRALVESSPDAIVVYADRGIEYANPAAARLTGVDSPLDLLGVSVLDYIHPDDRAFAARRVHRAFEAREALPPAEERVVRTDGSVVDVETIGVPVLYDGRQAVTVIVRDLTVSKAAERALRESEALLRQSQKMEAIGRLAGGIAHDLNNLLTPVIGLSDLMLADADLGDQHRADVVEIRRAADRAASLTRQLLAFSRRQPLQPQVLDLNGVVTGVQSLLQRVLGAEVRLVTDLDPELLPVEVDPAQFEQVVMNLVLNARDAMPEGGQLTIETANAPPGARDLGVDATQLVEGLGGDAVSPYSGPCVVLTVRDTGSGIEPDSMARVFEPFFTTKRPGEGTGLGLSTVYGIVRQSGGSIYVAGDPGQGAAFTVSLPAVPHATVAPERRVVESGEVEAGGVELVMIVEDEAPVLALATRVLRQLGYTILKAPNGTEALLALARTPRLDLLLTDVVLPGVGGRVIADAAAARFPGVRTLFMSGYAHDSVVLDGRVVEGISFLEKPFTPRQLARKVREVLDAGRSG